MEKMEKMTLTQAEIVEALNEPHTIDEIAEGFNFIFSEITKVKEVRNDKNWKN